MIKVNHEVPFCLLNASKKFNDYEFCLPHLLDQNEQYKQHFLDAKEEGRYIIMDNSLHELGTAYDTNRLLYWVTELEPDEFIVPDVWENYSKTVVNAREWINIPFPKNTTKVAVIQSNTRETVSVCTQVLKDLGYKKLAYSYGANHYKKNNPNLPDYLAKALGRVDTISYLYEHGLLTDRDNVHLLGTACPFEFNFYSKFKFIKTIDTSNPVMAALEGVKYDMYGIHPKPGANMNDYADVEFSNVNLDLIFHNTNMFKKYLNNNL